MSLCTRAYGDPIFHIPQNVKFLDQNSKEGREKEKEKELISILHPAMM